MSSKNLIILFICLISSSTLQCQIESKNEFWLSTGITHELLSVNATNIGSFKNRNRIGASIGIERRSYLNETLNINYGIHVKSFRKSFVFNTKEVFLEDLNLCIPVLFNYHLKLNKNHFGNFTMGLNGVVYTAGKASYASLDYEVELERKTGIFPNLVMGFGYKFMRKKTIEINLLYNMGFFQRKVENVKYIPSDSDVRLENNGSFVEIEFKFRISKSS